VLVEDRGLTGAEEFVLGHDHPRSGLQDDQRTMINHDRDSGSD